MVGDALLRCVCLKMLQVRTQLATSRQGGSVATEFNPSTKSLITHYLKHSSAQAAKISK
jgi:hypothetical protein